MFRSTTKALRISKILQNNSVDSKRCLRRLWEQFQSLYITKFEIFRPVDRSCQQLTCGKNRLRLRFKIHKRAKLFNLELPRVAQ